MVSPAPSKIATGVRSACFCLWEFLNIMTLLFSEGTELIQVRVKAGAKKCDSLY